MDAIGLIHTTILDMAHTSDVHTVLWNTIATEEHSFCRDFPIHCVQLDTCLQGISKVTCEVQDRDREKKFIYQNEDQYCFYPVPMSLATYC